MSKHFRLGVALSPGAEVEVAAGAAHHLERVLRVRVGQRFVGVGSGGEAHSVEVVALGPLRVAVGEAVELGADPAVALAVWVPLLKGGRTDDLVRQLTELGASRIVPWAGARSVVRLDAKRARSRVERWRAIAREATSQCGRIAVPEVAEVVGLPEAGPGVYLWEDAREPARTTLRELAAETGALAVLIGPEGGLSPEEAAALDARGWRPAWLGRRVLRAETAVLAAATLALHALGEGGY